MAFGTVYLDSNIFIALLGGDANETTAGLLRDMIAQAEGRSDQPLATSQLSLAECLVRPLREGDAETIEAAKSIIAESGWLRVGEVSRSVLIAAAELRGRSAGVKLPDAIHVATAIELGCSHVLSADNGIRSQGNIDVLRPGDAVLEQIVGWLRA